MPVDQRKQFEKVEDQGDGNGQAPYLLVDYGEQLVSEIEQVRNELHKQMVSVQERQNRIWNVIVSFSDLLDFIMIGLSLSIVTIMMVNVVGGVIPISLMLGSVVFLAMSLVMYFINTRGRLVAAIALFHEHTPYTPCFPTCTCYKCVARRSESQTHAISTSQNVDNVGADKQGSNTETECID